MPKIRVLITDDHALFRQGVCTLLAAEPDLEIAGEAKDAAEAINLSRQSRPDVVLMDIGMTGMSSFEATRVIRGAPRNTRRVPLHV
jgi:DNA-binding NarL/FixJ family response regulator